VISAEFRCSKVYLKCICRNSCTLVTGIVIMRLSEPRFQEVLRADIRLTYAVIPARA